MHSFFRSGLLLALGWLAFCHSTLVLAGTLPSQASGLDFPRTITRAKEKIYPAVVFIQCVREDFERGVRSKVTVTGSGVVISPEGRVLTNWHVIERALEIRCLLNTGEHYEAQLLGSDKDTDLALLQLRSQSALHLPSAELRADDRMSDGDFVMAFGAPWGLNRSISFGIVSCINRYLPECSEYSGWIQTDASICPGNSGGPLVDTEGRVVGLNARGGGDLGFAIPVSTIRVLIPRLASNQGAAWSWMGIKLQPLRDFHRNIYFEGDAGAIVSASEEGSPAAEAGLKAMDLLLAVNGRPLTALMEENLPDVRRELALLPVGKVATLHLRRDGKELDLQINPRVKGSVSGESIDLARWDFTAKSINRHETPELYHVRQEGVYVEGIRYPGNASMCGLRPHDIILRVNGLEVRGIDSFRELHVRSLSMIASGSTRVVLTVLRNSQQLQIAYDISRDFTASE